MTRPNLLVVMTDQQKATSLGLYGNPDLRTPALEEMAGRGLLYRHAFTPHPLCVPARVSLWTGRYPHQHGSRSNEIFMPENEPHAARVLKQAGYTLALVGKNHCFRKNDLALFDHVYLAGHTGPQGAEDLLGVAEARRFYKEYDFRPRWAAHAIDYPRERCAAWLIAERVRELFQAQKEGRITGPLCAWMSIPDPHPPYAAPEPYASQLDPEALSLPPWVEGEFSESGGKPQRQRFFHALSRWSEATEVDIRRALGMYYAQSAFADECFGRVTSEIERLGLAQGTIVAFTSDHGDYAGEHRMMTKSSSMYDCMTRVPLVLSWPGTLPEGRTQDELVTTIDVVPTLLRLAGVEAPPALTVDAVNARGLPGTGTGSLPAREAVFAEYAAGGPYVSEIASDLMDVDRTGGVPRLPYLRARECEGRLKMVRTQRWKYVYDPGDPIDELYDLAADPWELTNLAARPDCAATVTEMRKHLLDWSLETEDPRPVPLHYNLTTFEHTETPTHWQHPHD
jgi:arylsulfatase A-like enzyme